MHIDEDGVDKVIDLPTSFLRRKADSFNKFGQREQEAVEFSIRSAFLIQNG